MTDFSKLVSAWQRFYTLLSPECLAIEPLELLPVLSQNEIRIIQKKWSTPIPQVLKDFWATGCSGIKFEYAKSVKSLSSAKRIMLKKASPFITDYITGSFRLTPAHDTLPQEQQYWWNLVTGMLDSTSPSPKALQAALPPMPEFRKLVRVIPIKK